MLKPDLILCLGNEVLRDDGFGAEVARRLEKVRRPENDVEVIFAPLAGFALLDLLASRERVLIVDSIRTNKSQPGTLMFFKACLLVPGNHLINSHQMSLPTALKLGTELGLTMPLQIDVLAVEVEDVETLSEELSPSVAGSVDDAIKAVQSWISSSRREKKEAHEDRKACTERAD